jgi:hypothetical protein
MIKPFIVKYLNINRNRKGARQKTISQLVKESQFFLFLKTFILEKNSLII